MSLERVTGVRLSSVSTKHISVLAAMMALAPACSSESNPPPASTPDAALPSGPVTRPRRDFGYPMDDVLRMNHVQAKATHNSYHVETAGNTLAEWKYNHAPLDVQLESQGVRAVELDTRLVEATDRFEVFHLPGLDEQTTCRAFVDCLRVLDTWSRAHPKHVPILVQIEPKDAPPTDAEPYFAKLEKEILSVWARERIVAPDDIQRDSPTLREGVTSKGWPVLAEVRGTILFYVDNSSDWRAAYTRGGKSLAGRLMFVDSKEDDSLAAFVIANDPDDRARIDAAARAGFLVRTRADAAGSAAKHEAALATAAHALSSDAPLSLVLPGGTPVRCNPVAAPPGCSPGALEDPTRLR